MELLFLEKKKDEIRSRKERQTELIKRVLRECWMMKKKKNRFEGGLGQVYIAFRQASRRQCSPTVGT
jgi:hypothetical protein